MAITREGVANALLTQINAAMTAAGAVTVSRRLLHWSDVESSQQPAVYIAAGAQAPKQDPGGLTTVWRVNFEVYIYAWESDNTKSPSTQINNLLDALEAALAPVQPAVKQTLGGTVSHCWISGSVITDEGVLGPQGMAIVPIEVLYPAK